MQSAFAYQPASSVKRIAITNVDSWLGCCTAYYLAEELEKKCKGVELVCLARKTENLDKLKKFKNVHIHKTDYEDRECIEKGLRGVCLTILIPEQDEHRAKLSKNVLHAMKAQKVKSLILISVEGADQAPSNLKEIKSYHEIEKDVQECCDCYVVLRKSFMNQCFLLWAPIVQEHGEFPITTDKDSEMAPVDMCDVICAIETIVIDYCRHEGSHKIAQPSSSQHQHQTQQEHFEVEDVEHFGKHKNKTYTLTGSQKITLERLVQELSELTGEQIKLKHVSRDELRKYFESLKKREDWDEELDVDRCYRLLRSAFAEVSGENEEEYLAVDYHEHHHYVPNEATINLILDELELVKKGEAGFVSGDLEKITGHHGKSIKDFLRKEKDAFKPRHRRQ